MPLEEKTRMVATVKHEHDVFQPGHSELLNVPFNTKVSKEERSALLFHF